MGNCEWDKVMGIRRRREREPMRLEDGGDDTSRRDGGRQRW
jgi:hypothetical protein